MPESRLILIVSDDPSSLSPLSERLDRLGYTPKAVSSDTELMRAAEADAAALALFDARTNPESALGLVTILRGQETAREMPVVVVAAADDDRTRRAALPHADEVLPDPSDLDEVMPRIERLLTIAELRTALRRSEAEFRAVMESAIDAIISGDSEGRIRFWNRAAAALFGFTAEEALGQPIEMIIPERYRQRHRQGVHRVSAGGESRVIGTTVELAAVRKDGTEFPVELSLATWILDERHYYTGIIRDIRVRKEAEAALRRSEKTLRERTEELERTVRQLQEVRNEMIVHEKMAALGRLAAGMAHELNNPVSAALRGTADLAVTFKRWQETQLAILELRLDARQLEHVRSLEATIRERVRRLPDMSALERADREARIEAWLAEHDLDTEADIPSVMVGLGVSQQELRSLEQALTEPQVTLIVQWLALGYSIQSLLEQLTLSTGRVVEIVRALRTYSNLDQAPVQTVDVREGLENTLIVLGNKLEGLDLIREFPDELPRVKAYASELNQVWTSLIDNAADALAGRGTLTIRARAEPPWVIVEIEDSGPGIPDELQTKVFDPFFTTKAPGQGSGLGLNVACNLIIQKHQGEIALDSEPGRTRFTVRLPIDAEPPGE